MLCVERPGNRQVETGVATACDAVKEVTATSQEGTCTLSLRPSEEQCLHLVDAGHGLNWLKNRLPQH